MRYFLLATPIILLAAACSSTPVSAPTPQPVAAPKPAVVTPAVAATPAAVKAPQCYNGDTGKFDALGTKATLSGVKVECKPTSDGKSATWHTAK